jgi:hypothetical protein
MRIWCRRRVKCVDLQSSKGSGFSQAAGPAAPGQLDRVGDLPINWPFCRTCRWTTTATTTDDEESEAPIVHRSRRRSRLPISHKKLPHRSFAAQSCGRLASSSSKFCIEDEDDDEEEDEGATVPFSVPPTRRLKLRWAPPSPAVGEKSSRPDLPFLYGGGPPSPFRPFARDG